MDFNFAHQWLPQLKNNCFRQSNQSTIKVITALASLQEGTYFGRTKIVR